MIVLPIIVVVAAFSFLGYTHYRQQAIIGELLDRIMQLQALPPVTRPIPTIPSEEDETPAPRKRPLVDRMTFRVR